MNKTPIIRAKALALSVQEAEPSPGFEAAWQSLFEPLLEIVKRPAADGSAGAQEAAADDTDIPSK